MTSIVESVLSPVVDMLWAKVEPKLDKKLDELIDKVMALLPMLAASAATAVAEEVLKGDPDIPGVSGVFDLSETIRKVVNEGTPVGIHIPGLSELGSLFNKPPGSP